MEVKVTEKVSETELKVKVVPWLQNPPTNEGWPDRGRWQSSFPRLAIFDPVDPGRKHEGKWENDGKLGKCYEACCLGFLKGREDDVRSKWNMHINLFGRFSVVILLCSVVQWSFHVLFFRP